MNDVAVKPVKYAALCRLCRRELVAVQSKERGGGKVYIDLTCPKHGTLKRGERYLMGYVEKEIK